MEWLKRFSLALDYIEHNLAGDISYEEAARIACCSTCYFQRLFSCLAGIPLSEYIRRRRMTQAAFELQAGGAKATEIGLKYGYASAASFNRAFQSVHGVTPTAARQEGTLLNNYPRLSFRLTMTGGESMRYRIESKGPLRVVGIRTDLQQDIDQNFKLVPVFWKTTLNSERFPRIAELSDQIPQGVLGITSYQNPQAIYYYIAAATDRPVPEGMAELSIPAATWVIFEGEGHFQESVQTIFKRFLTEWLPFSGYEYAELPDIEIYPESDPPSVSGRSEVWIAVRKTKQQTDR